MIGKILRLCRLALYIHASYARQLHSSTISAVTHNDIFLIVCLSRIHFLSHYIISSSLQILVFNQAFKDFNEKNSVDSIKLCILNFIFSFKLLCFLKFWYSFPRKRSFNLRIWLLHHSITIHFRCKWSWKTHLRFCILSMFHFRCLISSYAFS